MRYEIAVMNPQRAQGEMIRYGIYDTTLGRWVQNDGIYLTTEDREDADRARELVATQGWVSNNGIHYPAEA